jgi:endoglucanase
MSLFWSQWIGKYYNYDCVQWLRDDWNCTVVRAAMAVESGGYLFNPEVEKTKIRAVIDACIDLGIYVIVDWHDHHAQWHRDQSVAFFEELASEYGDRPNLIYEIYNEPLQVSWRDSIKPYCDTVVKHIRAIDPDNLILVGSSTWSQDVDLATIYPIIDTNVAYTLHFYSATHKQSLRSKATTALGRGYAIFVSEFGTCESSGSGFLDSLETETWMTFMNNNKISWCNWSIADQVETSAALLPNASSTGGWLLTDLTRSGYFIRKKIKEENERMLNSVSSQTEIPRHFALYQNYPNPFNPITNLSFTVPSISQVTLKMYDILGREIETIASAIYTTGTHNINWNAGQHASGVYIIRMIAQSENSNDPIIQMRKLLLLK